MRVKTIGRVVVPSAMIRPGLLLMDQSTRIYALAGSWTVVPASIFRVAPFLTVTDSVATWLPDHVVSVVMS
jgi:hypothetical protein